MAANYNLNWHRGALDKSVSHADLTLKNIVFYCYHFTEDMHYLK